MPELKPESSDCPVSAAGLTQRESDIIVTAVELMYNRAELLREVARLLPVAAAVLREDGNERRAGQLQRLAERASSMGSGIPQLEAFIQIRRKVVRKHHAAQQKEAK